jgi:hypothetical protein
MVGAEYTQMAGRAGRRGIDTEGHAIICANMFEPPDAETMRGIVAGSPRSVVSRLKLSYAMVLEGDLSFGDTGAYANTFSVVDGKQHGRILSFAPRSVSTNPVRSSRTLRTTQVRNDKRTEERRGEGVLS